MAKVHIYTSTYCGYCRAAKGLLRKKGVEYVEIDLRSDHDLRAQLVEKHKWRTLPMIVLNDELIGGYKELVELERTGKLERILAIEIQE